jgi:hypothetical protein
MHNGHTNVILRQVNNDNLGQIRNFHGLDYPA